MLGNGPYQWITTRSQSEKILGKVQKSGGGGNRTR
jgi:hypothetical protein